jgi:hypothetical protein
MKTEAKFDDIIFYSKMHSKHLPVGNVSEKKVSKPLTYSHSSTRFSDVSVAFLFLTLFGLKRSRQALFVVV